MDNQNVWIIGEQNHGEIKQVTYELLKRGKHLADKLEVDLTAVLLSPSSDKNQLNTLIQYGADKVRTVVSEDFQKFTPDPYIQTISELIHKYTPEIILASATTTGRTIAPAIAIKCQAGLTADCTELDVEKDSGNLIQTRPAIGGNIMATIKTPEHRPQIATVRPHSNQPMSPEENRNGKILFEEVPEDCFSSRVKQIGFEKNEEERTNLQDANIVVAGGKGCQKEENFDKIRQLADLLNGAVGASRDVVDLDWIPYPHQVGLSGKTISPKVYIALGISGAVQHLAGIKTAKNIIAINTDPAAPIFNIADLGVQADMFDILPELIQRLQEL